MERLVVRRDPWGHIDVAALEASVDAVAMKAWILTRFTGADGLVPLDDDALERPDQLFADLWRRARPDGPLRGAIGRALAELVDDAWSDPDRVPAWLSGVLWLAAETAAPELRARLAAVLSSPRFSAEAVSSGIDQQWLEAAAAQPLDADVRPWQQLLAQPRYARIAYSALQQHPDLAAYCLPDFLRWVPAGDREFFTGEVLRDLLLRHHDAVIDLLRKHRDRLAASSGLCEALDAAAAQLGRPPIFGPPRPPSELFPSLHEEMPLRDHPAVGPSSKQELFGSRLGESDKPVAYVEDDEYERAA